MSASSRAPHTIATRPLPPQPPRAVPWVLAAAGVLVQIAFPLTGGGTLGLTVASVVLFSAAAVADAAVRFGPAVAASVLAGAGGVGLVAEAVGVRTGLPFGDYDYTGTLGAEVADVPVLVPLAWVMMAWPALAVARRLVGARGRVATAVVGACALTAWDVFLDPQMVDAGHWAWEDPTPALPGVEGIPLTNFAGWLVVSLVVVALLDRLVPRGTGRGHDARGAAPDAVPLTIYLWTYFSSVLAHAVFFGRPPVALVGAVLMGLVAWPLVVALVRERRR
ncbi:carotenoid biosynthesis protein [Nocardioides sp. AX2bis]|uniref:carotenoid biosynthesis protein n=1 Tax=Nocardioides sp. AX2bis TaxID=2653157 RepID=UPI0012F3ED74|nr:carotenoid biosynthesis protein [Nocardioides sp. AX2bis]VXC45401.1 putative Bisanhydrobacterioruberin hydratase [Nocardioides sp. AX2bis]